MSSNFADKVRRLSGFTTWSTSPKMCPGILSRLTSTKMTATTYKAPYAWLRPSQPYNPRTKLTKSSYPDPERCSTTITKIRRALVWNFASFVYLAVSKKFHINFTFFKEKNSNKKTENIDNRDLKKL